MSSTPRSLRKTKEGKEFPISSAKTIDENNSDEYFMQCIDSGGNLCRMYKEYIVFENICKCHKSQKCKIIDNDWQYLNGDLYRRGLDTEGREHKAYKIQNADQYKDQYRWCMTGNHWTKIYKDTKKNEMIREEGLKTCQDCIKCAEWPYCEIKCKECKICDLWPYCHEKTLYDGSKTIRQKLKEIDDYDKEYSTHNRENDKKAEITVKEVIDGAKKVIIEAGRILFNKVESDGKEYFEKEKEKLKDKIVDKVTDKMKEFRDKIPKISTSADDLVSRSPRTPKTPESSISPRSPRSPRSPISPRTPTIDSAPLTPIMDNKETYDTRKAIKEIIGQEDEQNEENGEENIILDDEEKKKEGKEEDAYMNTTQIQEDGKQIKCKLLEGGLVEIYPTRNKQGLSFTILNSSMEPITDEIEAVVSYGDDPISVAPLTGDHAGGFVIVFLSSFSVLGKRFGANGKAIDNKPFVISESKSENSCRLPNVTSLLDGSFVAVWFDGLNHVMSSKFNDNNGGDTAPTSNFIRNQVNQNLIKHTRLSGRKGPKIATVNNGDYIIVWNTCGFSGDVLSHSSQYDIAMRRFSSNGKAINNETKVNTIMGSNTDPIIKAYIEGGYKITFSSYSGDDCSKLKREYYSNDKPINGEEEREKRGGAESF